MRAHSTQRYEICLGVVIVVQAGVVWALCGTWCVMCVDVRCNEGFDKICGAEGG